MSIKEVIISDIKNNTKKEKRKAVKDLQSNLSIITGVERLGMITIAKNLLDIEEKDENDFIEEIVKSIYAFAAIIVIKETLKVGE